MKRKEIKSKTVTQSNDATSINCRRGKIKRAKRHSSKKLRQLTKVEVVQEDSMGYYMSQSDTSFTILAKNKEKALEAIKKLVGKETIKDGGGSHFSWVHTEDFINAATIEEALKEWRWIPTMNEAGDVESLKFSGEKYGDDMLLFKAIAKYVEKDSYITMRGEDGVGCLMEKLA